MGLDLFFNKTKRQAETLVSFRKINFLIAFFESKGYVVKNGTPIVVKKADCEELLDRCNKVLGDHSLADYLLPTKDGFFFGGTAYDEWYFDDVKRIQCYLSDVLLSTFDRLAKDEVIEFEVSY